MPHLTVEVHVWYYWEGIQMLYLILCIFAERILKSAMIGYHLSVPSHQHYYRIKPILQTY